VWNEPNVSLFWRPAPDPRAYALLVRRVSEAMRAVDPAIKIVAGVLAMVDVPQPRPARSTAARAAGAFGVRPQLNRASGISIADAIEYAQTFLSEPGTAEAVDILTYHPYNPAPEATVDDIAALCETIRAIKPGLPVWQGECGCPSSGDTIHFRGDAPWGYNVQCKWLLRRLLTDYLAGAGALPPLPARQG
jgi:hypothetical protein